MTSLKKNLKKKIMWTVIKFDKKINLFKEDFKNKIDNDFELYIPKIRLLKRSKNRLVKKNLIY